MEQGKSSNTLLIWTVVIVGVFFFVIMPAIEKCYLADRQSLKEALENVGHGPKLDTNKCARSCCVNSGWPLPEELKPKDLSPEELANYIPTNFSCNLGSNTGGGCVCVTKDDYKYLSSRGTNAQEKN
jgi:hypothetical protein